MRGLIFAAMLAVIGCGAHGQAASKKPAPEAAPAAVLDCDADRAMERRVAVYLAERGDKAVEAAQAWKKKAMQLQDDYEDLIKRCK